MSHSDNQLCYIFLFTSKITYIATIFYDYDYVYYCVSGMDNDAIMGDNDAIKEDRDEANKEDNLGGDDHILDGAENISQECDDVRETVYDGPRWGCAFDEPGIDSLTTLQTKSHDRSSVKVGDSFLNKVDFSLKVNLIVIRGKFEM